MDMYDRVSACIIIHVCDLIFLYVVSFLMGNKTPNNSITHINFYTLDELICKCQNILIHGFLFEKINVVTCISYVVTTL